MKAGNHCIKANGVCRIAEYGYWKCSTAPPSCAFKDEAHAERVLEMLRQKSAGSTASLGSQTGGR